MPKEKHRYIDEKQERSTMFYYEIIGSVLIILSITTLGKLGKIGKIFTMLLKVLFGDWYFIAILFLLFLGIFNLFLHTRFNFKDNRFVGFIFLSLTIFLFSHFSIHKYVLENSVESNSSYLSITIDYYKNYINTQNTNSLGGGIIGAFIFYLIYYLLGQIGVCLLGIILFILSISLIFNTPFLEIGKWFVSKLSKVLSGFKSFNRFFRYEVGKDFKSSNKNVNYIKLPLNVFKEFNDNDTTIFQEEDAKTNLNLITNYLDSKSITYETLPYIVSYLVTTYYFKINVLIMADEINSYFYDIRKILLNNQLANEVLFSYENNNLIIQISSRKTKLLSVRELIILNKNKEINNIVSLLPLGIDYQNNVINLNINNHNNIMLISENKIDIVNYIKYIIAINLFYNKSSDLDFYLYDLYDNYDIFSNIINMDNDIYSFFDNIKSKTEDWNQELLLNGIYDYKSYIEKKQFNNLNITIKRRIIIISIENNDNKLINLNDLENYLLYLTQIAKKLGLFIIYCLTSNKYVNNAIISMFETKVCFKIDNDLKNKFTDITDVYSNALYLENNNDAYFIQKRSSKRICVPQLSSQDLERISKICIK